MTRDEALTTLGLRPGASEREIDAALEQEQRRRQKGQAGQAGQTGQTGQRGQKGQKAMNGSDQAMRAKFDAARETLRGKEG
jgi:hypothetical protein